MLSHINVIVEQVFPIINAKVVQTLQGEVSQKTLAQYLGITQAMVSKYAYKKLPCPSAHEKEIDRFVQQISQSIRNKESVSAVAQQTTQQCLEWMKNGLVVDMTNAQYGSQISPFVENDPRQQERNRVLHELSSALQQLEEQNPVHVIPQVRMNIAQALSSPVSKEDVAAVPGRITIIDNKITTGSTPQFGSSNYLASLIMKRQQQDESCHAITNVAFTDKIKQRLEKKNLQTASLQEIKSAKDQISYFIEEGKVGIEPNLYIVGQNAGEVIEKVLQL